MGCCSSTLSHAEDEDSSRRRNNSGNGFGQQPQQTLNNVTSPNSGHVAPQTGLEQQEQESDMVKRPDVVITRPSTSSIQSSFESSNDNRMSMATTSNEKETFSAETSTAVATTPAVTQNHEMRNANDKSNISHLPPEDQPATFIQSKQQQSTIPAHNTTMTTTHNTHTNNSQTNTCTAPGNNNEEDVSQCTIFVRLSSNGQDIKVLVPNQPPYLTIAGLRKELSPHLDTLNASTTKPRVSIAKLIYLGRILSDQYVIVPLTSNSENIAKNNEDIVIPSLPPASPSSSITKHILHHHHSNHQTQQQQKVYIQKQGVIQAMVTRS